MKCVKRGAIVFIQNYSGVVVADLYQVGDYMVIDLPAPFEVWVSPATSMKQWNRKNNPITHYLDLTESAPYYFKRMATAIMVPAKTLIEVTYGSE